MSYYPGCCLKTTAREYGESLLEVCAALGLDLVELEDWNCCAPVPFYSGNGTLAAGLAARNLVLAARAGTDLVGPCPGCYRRLRETALALEGNGALRGKVERLLGTAQRAGAQIPVTACPVCLANLEWRRGRTWRRILPVLYFTELLGLALGTTMVRKWLRAHLVDPGPVLDLSFTHRR